MMKKSYNFLIVINAVLLLAAFSMNVHAQGRPADLIEGFPAKTVSQENSLSANIIKQGSPAIASLCQMLQPPQTGGDVKVRYAIGSLTQYAGRPGASADRKVVVEAYLKVLSSDIDKQVKFFLIKELQWIGKEESIKPLSVYLTDGQLCKPAARTLEAIGGAGVESSLINTLSTREDISDESRMAIIHVLGNLRSEKAAKLIRVYADSKEIKLKQTAQAALANIGDLAAQSILAEASGVGTPYAKAKATSNYLLFVKRLAQKGDKDKAAAICRELIKTRNTVEDKNIPCEALSILADVEGRESLPDMLAAMDTPNDQFHAVALRLTGQVAGSDVTSQWVNKIQTVAPDAQVKIIAMLGQRKDKTAQAGLINLMKSSKEKNVRFASYAALGDLIGPMSIGLLIDALKADQEDEVNVIMNVLKQLPGEPVNEMAAVKFSNLSTAGQIAIINLFDERGATGQKALVLTCAGSNPEMRVKLAAYKAIKRVASSDDVEPVLAMMLKAEDSKERSAASKAVVSLVGEISDPQKRAQWLLKAFENSTDVSDKVLLISLLPQIGGDDALAVVVKATGSDNSDLRDTALRALAKWQDVAAADPTLELASSVKELKYHVLLMRNYFQIVASSSMLDVNKLNGYNNALEIARRPDEKNLIQLKKNELLATFNRPPAGFVALFNGKDLTGWKGLLSQPNDNPIKRSELSAEKLAEEQAKANENLKAHWSVQDGVLMFDGQGFSCVTEKDYKNFEMLVDWKIVNPRGDSGIYLRGTPQIQIWDPGQHHIGSGGLYNNKTNSSKPLVTADNPIGQWNTFRIKMINQRVTVHLNGQLVVDNTILENFWNRELPIFPSGQIELQCHGDPIHFRNIYIREIIHNTLSEQEEKDGFELLFNGKDHTGWVGDTKGYPVVDGNLSCKGGRNIFTDQVYDNFTLRFDFKLFPGTNNGLGIRAPLEGDAAYVGMELQILDNTAKQYFNKLKDYQYHGSVYGAKAAKRGYLKPVGEWNHEEVIVDGSQITVILNGTVITEADIAKEPTAEMFKSHPGLKNKEGHIGFLGHGAPIEFRNIKIKKH
ncbi:MAG: DUF1080 domain-containing protein [Phycisphaerae bacterium]|nr:DUF1080 domain-containing protein [Phycisphaerae bacterium]